MKRKWLLGLCSLVVAATVLSSCAPAAKPGPSEVPDAYKAVRLVGTSLGSAGCTTLMSLAVILNKYYPEIEWSSTSGPGSGVHAIYMTKGTIQVGIGMAMSYIQSFGYEEVARSRLRMLAHSLPVQNYPFLIPKDKPWQDITQVPKGTGLRVGTPGTGEIIGAEACLNVAGLSKDYFRWLPMGKTEGVDAWRSGKIDMFFCNVEGPAPWLMDMVTSPRKPKPLGLTPEQIKKANAEKAFERLGFLPGERTNLVELVPEVFTEEVYSPKAALMICCRDDFPEVIAYRIAKVIDERREELTQVYRSWKCATPEHHIKYAVAPYELHSGVAKYYREKGYLK